MRRERLEGRMRLERLAELAPEGLEAAIAAAGRERGPERVEDRAQHLPDAGMLDEGRLAQSRDARRGGLVEACRLAASKARDRRRIDVQRLEEQARGGGVGRNFGAVGFEQGVDGAQAQEGGAEPARALRRIGGVRIAADAEVSARAQAVELRRDAPVARALCKVARLEAARRRGDQRRLGALAPDLER